VGVAVKERKKRRRSGDLLNTARKFFESQNNSRWGHRGLMSRVHFVVLLLECFPSEVGSQVSA
jgi:hypothetical protein